MNIRRASLFRQWFKAVIHQSHLSFIHSSFASSAPEYSISGNERKYSTSDIFTCLSHSAYLPTVRRAIVYIHVESSESPLKPLKLLQSSNHTSWAASRAISLFWIIRWAIVEIIFPYSFTKWFISTSIARRTSKYFLQINHIHQLLTFFIHRMVVIIGKKILYTMGNCETAIFVERYGRKRISRSHQHFSTLVLIILE